MVRGRKRYVLLPPEECGRLNLYPRGHPSGRHASADWTKIDWSATRGDAATGGDVLRGARATETVLAAGELLYIPSYWFHFIVSQDASVQCNSRSGDSSVGRDAIERCEAENTARAAAAVGGGGEGGTLSAAELRAQRRENLNVIHFEE